MERTSLAPAPWTPAGWRPQPRSASPGASRLPCAAAGSGPSALWPRSSGLRKMTRCSRRSPRSSWRPYRPGRPRSRRLRTTFPAPLLPAGLGWTLRASRTACGGVDAAFMTTAAVAISVPTLLASDIVHRRCLCNPSEIDGFDPRAQWATTGPPPTWPSDVTAVLAIARPPLLGPRRRVSRGLPGAPVLNNGAALPSSMRTSKGGALCPAAMRPRRGTSRRPTERGSLQAIAAIRAVEVHTRVSALR